MSLGRLHREATTEEKSAVIALFAGTRYRLTWMRGMDGWYKTHLALILPVAYRRYAVGCDLRKTTPSPFILAALKSSVVAKVNP